MEGVCLRAICASENLPHKEVLCKPFRGEFCLGGSVDVCPEPVSHFMTICWHLMWRWIPKNMQSVVLACAFKELTNLEHWCSGLFCIIEWNFLKQVLCKAWVRVWVSLNFMCLRHCHTSGNITEFCVVAFIHKAQGNYFLTINKWLL